MRRSKEIVALLLVFVALASVVLWTVVSRKAAPRDAPAAQRPLGPVAPDPPRNP